MAMDHTRVFDTVTGLKDIESVASMVIGAGADALLTSYGSTACISGKLDKCGVWLSVDSQPGTVNSIVETSLRMGVEGIKVFVLHAVER